jgi:hypothetical protein
MSDSIEVDGLVVGTNMVRNWQNELDHLRRIEKAARELVDSMHGVRLPYHHTAWEHLLNLRAALEGSDIDKRWSPDAH